MKRPTQPRPALILFIAGSFTATVFIAYLYFIFRDSTKSLEFSVVTLSPDHQHAAVTGWVANSQDRTYIIDLSIETRPVIADLEGVFQTWSPDSQQLVILRRGAGFETLWLTDLSGTIEIQIDQWLPKTSSNYSSNDPQWSPNGAYIAFTSYRNGSRLLYSYSVRNSEPEIHQLTNFAVLGDPFWSPNADFIGIVSNQEQAEKKDLFLVDTQDMHTENIFTYLGSISNSSWSPDGSRIAFVLGDVDNSVYRIYIFNILSRETNVVSNVETYILPSLYWSPDGKKLAYIQNSKLMLWEGDRLREIEECCNYPTGIVWGQDSAAIYAASYSGIETPPMFSDRYMSLKIIITN